LYGLSCGTIAPLCGCPVCKCLHSSDACADARTANTFTNAKSHALADARANTLVRLPGWPVQGVPKLDQHGYLHLKRRDVRDELC